MASYRVRKLPGEDIGLILDIDRAVFPDDAPPILVPSEWWALTDSRGRDVGFAGAVRIMVDGNSVVYLQRAGVLPEAQGQGLQRRLIRARERWGRSLGVDAAYTYTHHDNIASANNLIRCGYRMFQPKDGGPDRARSHTWIHWLRPL